MHLPISFKILVKSMEQDTMCFAGSVNVPGIPKEILWDSLFVSLQVWSSKSN